MIKTNKLFEHFAAKPSEIQEVLVVAAALGFPLRLTATDYSEFTRHYVITQKAATAMSGAGATLAILSLGRKIPKQIDLHLGETLCSWNIVLSRGDQTVALTLVVEHLLAIAKEERWESICLEVPSDARNTSLLIEYGFIPREFGYGANLENYYILRI